MSAGARQALEALLDCVFPVTCAACPKPGRAPFCALCAEALEPAPPLELPGLASVGVPYEYGGPVALAVRALKFESRPEIGPPLGRWLGAAIERPVVDLVIPIPLGPGRLARRGYNQARELARGLGPVAGPKALRRSGERPPQVGLSRAERLENQRGAFVAEPARVKGRRVLLVDDVVSTGATLEAARAALAAAGATEVHAAAVARSLPSAWP